MGHTGWARRLRRLLRRVRLGTCPPRCSFVYDAGYEHQLPGTPLDPRRGEMILGFLRHEGLLRRGLLLRSRPATAQELLRAHSGDYLQSLQEAATVGRVFGVELTPEQAERAVELQRLMTGGTVRAARTALRSGRVAFNLGGGLHHALRDEGMAFCIFNDVAVAVADLRARGFAKPILVVDLDLHDGNGTRAIFAEDPSVHTFSIHGETWGPEEAAETTCIALGHGVEGRRFMDTLRSALPRVVASFQPELVFYVAGSDGAADDEIGDWQLDAATLLARDRFVTEQFQRKDRRVPLVGTLSGGYGKVAWRYPARFISWALSGSALEPPAEEEITIERLRRIGASLTAAELTQEPGRNDLPFELTEADLLGIDPGARRDTRFLGFFSRHGIELVLERFGVLERLREKGFAELRVDVDSSGMTGQTLRVLADERGTADLLVELRVHRSRAVVPEREMMVIEWLLLQNPRASFGSGRPALPGQQHPGLGLLKEFLGSLVVVCEMLKLDGIFFTPSHYHVAVQSRQVVRFLDPEHEARMRAYVEALEGVPLHEATRLVGENRLLDEATGKPVKYGRFPMVLPVSEALKEHTYGEAYQARVEKVLAGLRYRIESA